VARSRARDTTQGLRVPGTPAAPRRSGRQADAEEASMLSPRLHNLLDEHHAPYTTFHHERTVTAHDTAAATHVNRELFAKTVMLKVDGTMAMMVMPAAYRVDLTRLSRALGGAVVELAEETEFKDLFPDCEPGAMPPFGHLYGMPVYVDSRLAHQPDIVFNAGTHTDAVRMPYAEFEKLAEPEMLWLAHMM
jgi:Ala-tRNA(Pro) deacylase